MSGMRRPESRGFFCVEEAARKLREENEAMKKGIQEWKRKLELQILQEEKENQMINDLRVHNEQLQQSIQEKQESRRKAQEV